jgi:sulfate/thiosulfate transport system ATP-binding protein
VSTISRGGNVITVPIVLDQLSANYGHQVVLDRLSLTISEGELFVLLGPSGSGKSTVLRLVAGLLLPARGRILFGGRDVTHLPPQERGVGFVTQNYSIFCHMNVNDNIEFGLRIRNVPAGERARRRDELLEIVGLSGLGNRYSDQLSGGQRQRVALARALAYEPDVLLLDEPFGALDVKIRAQLRRSLREIQQRLGVTTLMVTHDREEAFELADRIGLMERGHLVEVGDAETLYRAPRTLFTATFLGAGSVLVGRARDGEACLGPVRLPLPEKSHYLEGAAVQVLLRPEHIRLSEQQPADEPVLGRGTIIEQSFSGPIRRIQLRLPRLPGTRQASPITPFGEEYLLMEALHSGGEPLASIDPWVSVRDWHILGPPQPRLLLCDDTQGSCEPLVIAQRLAQDLQGTLTILGVVGDSQAADQLHATLQRRKEEGGLHQAELRIRFGDRSEQILQEQSENGYDYVILTLRRASGRSLQPDNATLSLLGRLDAPVLLANSQPSHLSRLLICTAAGEPGKGDVRVGGRLARRLGASVTLLHVATEPAKVSQATKSHLERAAATLHALDVPCEIHVRHAAAPVEGILQEAREGNHDLIVVGNQGPEARRPFSPHHVTSQVIARSRIPMLVVPYTVD